MYDIALSVAACARSGTRADVAWMIEPSVSDEALAFTPGGGRLGTLAGGAFDGFLADVAARQLPEGRLVRHEVTAIEAPQCGLAEGTAVQFLVVPVAQFPAALWPQLLQREAVAITATLDGDVVAGIEATSGDQAQGKAAELVAADRPAAAIDEVSVITVLAPVRHLVVAGRGPIADALVAQARLLGWKATAETRPDVVAGLAAALSWLDAIVVMGHDVEPSSRCLMAALDSDAGYIGALGSEAMQQARADWLAYRDVTDLSRVNGPAGLAIGSQGPAEIAVSIVAQIIAVARL